MVCTRRLRSAPWAWIVIVIFVTSLIFGLTIFRASLQVHFLLWICCSHILPSGSVYIQLYLHIYGVDYVGSFSPQDCSYHTMLCASFVMDRYLAKLVFFSVPQNADLFIRADLFDISADNDITELFVQFDGAADAVSLLTGNQRRAAAAEGVEHHGVAMELF